jgi:5-methylthioribose kinase
MSDGYEVLTAETVLDYVARIPDLRTVLDPADVREVREVGDGNLNLVFVLSAADGRGLVLKQALPYVRLVGPSWPMTPDRARHEALALSVHGRLAPGLVPAMYHFDRERYVIAMEDLSDHRVWRQSLNEGRRDEGAAADMGEYVARVAFGTSVFGMDAGEEKRLLADTVNAQLCGITEDLVFTEPYVPAGRNSTLRGNEADARELAADDRMVREIGWLKWQFMTQAEALIHGDLHTGSVMVRPPSDGQPRSTKAFDSEFAFYGPVGFDLGALIGNYVLAAARAFAFDEDDRAVWALGLWGETWAAFESSFRALWPARVDPRMFRDGTLTSFLARTQVDSVGFAAAKMARRIVGLAKAADIETLPEDLREGAARGVLRTARHLAVVRHQSADPAVLAPQVAEILREARTR